MLQAQNHDNKVLSLIESLEQEFSQISSDRKGELQDLGAMINDLISAKDTAQVIFVCTHNSRRSQLAEIWLRLASKH